jgi:HAD superfamily hydrolase (TIGR01509 family)
LKPLHGADFCSAAVIPPAKTPTATQPTSTRSTTKEQDLHKKLELPDRPFKAYLFDCDGTIADSMPIHYVSWKAALDEWNCDFAEELFYAWGGKPLDEIVATLNTMHNLKMPVDAVVKRKENLYFELLHQLKPVPEVLEHIHAKHGQLPFAVVSGSTRDAVVRSLTALHLLDQFDTIVGAEDYNKSKPAPDAFLVAAARLGVEPKDCLVFEDTAMGIKAATAAGMASVLVPSAAERAAAAVIHGKV